MFAWAKSYGNQLQILIAKKDWDKARQVIRQAEHDEKARCHPEGSPLKLFLSETNLSSHIVERLRSANIITVENLLHQTQKEILGIHDLGEASLAECLRVLAGLGLSIHSIENPVATTASLPKRPQRAIDT